MKQLFTYFKGDKVIWIIVFILAIFSILTVYSSIVTLAYKYKSGNTAFFLFKHFIIIITGFFIMYFAHKLKYTYYSRLSQIVLIISIPLLIITLFTGSNINEASRWLIIPVINQSFQTSDLAKLSLIIYLARVLAKKQNNIKDFKETFIPLIIPVFLVCMFILPANFSTAALIFLVSLIMMFIAGISIKHLTILLTSAVLAFSIFIIIVYNSENKGRIGTWKNRIEYFINGEEKGNYQVEQAKIAIATGGLTGKGPGKSTQRNFLPNPYSDFIFAIIIEEYGIIGGAFILLLYTILFARSLQIARKSNNTFGTLMVLGLSSLLLIQALVNMSVAVNLLPVTGQPLPMVSMGGTSIWFTCLALGIILSVSRYEEELINSSKQIK